MRRTGGIALAVIAVLLVIGPRSTFAQERRRVVLMDIKGARGNKLYRSVRKLLERNHAVLPGSAYEKISRRRRLSKINPANVRRVCKDMGCDAVITGVLERDGSGYIFVLKIREAVGGQISKRIAMRLRRPRLSSKLASGLKTRLLDAIDDLDSVGLQEPEVDGDTATKNRFRDDKDQTSEEREIREREARIAERRAAREREAAEKARKDREVRDGDRDLQDRDRDLRDRDRDLRDRDSRFRDDKNDLDGRDRDVDRRSRDRDIDKNRKDFDDIRTGRDRSDGALVSDIDSDAEVKDDPRAYPILIMLGPSVQKRDLIFNARAGLVGAEIPTPFVGGPIPGGYIVGELYPLAFGKGKKSALSGLGFGFEFERMVPITIPSGQMQASAVQQRVAGGLRYRFNFGNRPTLPSLVLSAYYGQLSFIIDRSVVNVDVPSVQYSSVSAGAALRLPFSEKIAARLEVKGMAILSAGEIQLETEYGAGTVTGVDADLSLEFRLGRSFFLRGGGRFTFIGYAFDGSGAKTNRDGTAGSDVGGAADRYLGGFLTLGYKY